MSGYIISCLVLSLIILAFIPAMIAAHKDCPFPGWYIYGLLLFPVALVHSVFLKRPVCLVNVYRSSDERTRTVKTYRAVPVRKIKRKYSFGYICIVFLAKLLFSLFMAVMAYAVMRIFSFDIKLLASTCTVFLFLLSICLTITELCGYSHIPMLADEVTKRTIMIIVMSVIVSLVMYCLKVVITSNISQNHEFIRFLCTVIAFVVFLVILFKLQNRYYRSFANFFDYCVLSVFAYGMFASVMLVFLSLSKTLKLISVVLSMPMQLFNFSYFSDIAYLEKMNTIYSVALVHVFVAVLVLISGLRCRIYKRKELAARVEYRTKAFRMTRKRAIRRHIPKAGFPVIKPLK